MLISNSKNPTNDKHSWLQEAKNEIYEKQKATWGFALFLRIVCVHDAANADRLVCSHHLTSSLCPR